MKEFFKPNAKKIVIFLILTLVIVALWISGASFLRYAVFYLLAYPLIAIRGGAFNAQSNDPFILIPLVLIEWLVFFYPLSCLVYYYYDKTRK